MDSKTSKIPRFDGEDFGLWKRQVTIALSCKKMDAILRKQVGETKMVFTDEQKNTALDILFSSMDRAIARKVQTCEEPSDIMERLEQIYENTSPANVAKVLQVYYSYKKDASDDMSTHISKVEAMASQLQSVGEVQSEVSIMTKLLHSLPDSYNGLKTAWDSVPTVDQTRSNLVGRMLAHDKAFQPERVSGLDTALVAQAIKRGPSKDGKKQVKCFACGKMGHFKRDCKSRKSSETSQGINIALVVRSAVGHATDWVVDSGASKHVCCQRDWFTTFKPYSDQLQVGNKEWVQAAGIGSIRLKCRVGDQANIMTLEDVLYIPDMGYNLLSTGRAGKKGCRVTFYENGCQLHKDGKVLAVGALEEATDLAILNAQVVTDTALLVSTRRTLGEWHKSFGHVDPQAITEMVSKGCVEGLELSNQAELGCTACAEGKATHASHPGGVIGKPERVGDLVSTDLVGPITQESMGKKKYFMLAKDGFSGYSSVFLLKSKDEVCENLQRYFGEFEALSGKRIKVLLTDNGSEFNNASVKTLTSVEHVGLRFSSPYTPQQNGVAERNNRTILEAARAMIAGSGLPRDLWAEAVSTAVYTRNRVARRGHSKTPFEIFIGRKPFVGHLVPFGTPVQSLITDRRMGKFDPKTESGFVVGFTDRVNTYRIFVPSRRKVKITSDVIFGTRPCDLEVSHGMAAGRREDAGEATVSLEEVPGPSTSGDGRAIDMFFDDLQARTGRYTDPVDEFNQDSTKDDQVERSLSSPSAPPLLEAREIDISRQSQDISQHGRDISYPELSSHEVTQRSSMGAESDVTGTTFQVIRSAEPSPFAGSAIPRSPPQSRPRSNARSARDSNERGPMIMIAQHGLVEPSGYQNAVTGPEREKWIEAICEELKAHQVNRTWTVVDRPKEGTTLSAKWVFKLKRDATGKIDRFKARLVARGFQQREGVDFHETFAPVARMESIRILLAICMSRNWMLARFDVSTAFLNGRISEDIYLEPPEGMEIDGRQCLKLNKSLYGLRQAPYEWNSIFHKAMSQMGFASITSDSCVYKETSGSRFVAVYVDDGLVVGKDKKACLEVITSLNRHFTTKSIDGSMFLGMDLKDYPSGLYLSQRRYIRELLETYKMADSSAVQTPLADAKMLFEKQQDENVQAPYRALIGGLLYLAMCTRPDILFPTILLSRFNENPKQVHWAAAKRVLRYLKGTEHDGLVIRKSQPKVKVEAYSDASWGDHLDDRKSTSGLTVMIEGNLIVFASRKQTSVAQSTTEAEYMAACDAAKELAWVVKFLDELGVEHERPELFVDNRSTIQLIKNGDVKRRSRHIEIRYHYLRDEHAKGWFKLTYVRSEKQKADMFTKQLGIKQFCELKRAIGMGLAPS